MAKSSSNRTSRTWVWVVVAVVAWWAWSTYQDAQRPEPRPTGNVWNTGNVWDTDNVWGEPDPPGGVYYENPAPGDDGSYDCPPGGGPVYVGANDPAGLDGDGDGIGCE